MLIQLQLGRRDAASCSLIDGPLEVGWIRPGVIGFSGFDDHAEAVAAGTAAAAVVASWARARIEGGLVEFAGDVGADDAIKADDLVVGRVLHPAAVGTDLPGYGFELAVPHATWLAVMLELAQRIHSGMTARSRHRLAASPSTEVAA